jgi:hypothetical protein
MAESSKIIALKALREENSTHSDFISRYLQYVSGTETPVFFHRWSAIAAMGAFLERRFHFQHGHFDIYPNCYVILLGNPGTRKSTAIKRMKALIKSAGYTSIAADKTTKEKFLLDLAGEETNAEDPLDANLWGKEDSDVSNCFIMADEFNDFFGNNNLEFISLLGTLWDYTGTYESRVKNSKSVTIPNPTISILGGNTPTGFATGFPVEIFGQGFFSRLILVHADPSGKRITFPSPPTPEDTQDMIDYLRHVKMSVIGQAAMSRPAEKLLDKIYKSYTGVNDVRFESYSNRRFTHLLKLCLIHSAASLSTTISESTVIYANTILSHTEKLMPRALGEFGKAKDSGVTHKVMQILDSTHTVLTLNDIWKHVHNDLESVGKLGDLLRNLIAADKVMPVKEPRYGFLPKKKPVIDIAEDTVDWSYLTQEEREMSI